MLSEYTASTDIPVWTLATNRGQYCLRETEATPEGPALFTSPEAAERFLDLHADLWGNLLGARIVPVPVKLQGANDLWKQAGRGGEAVVYVDVRPSLGGFGSFDAEYLR